MVPPRSAAPHCSPKGVKFSPAELEAISRLTRALEAPSFSALVRRAFRELAQRHQVAWPEWR